MAYEPTGFAADLLASARFTPFAAGHLVAQVVADQTGVDIKAVGETFDEFLREGWLEPVRADPKLGPLFQPTAQAWRVREQLLARRGLRHHALARQREYPLRSLIIALLKTNHIFNRRTPGGFLGMATHLPAEHLGVYLWTYSAEEIVAECKSLAEQRFLMASQRGGELHYDLWTLGTKVYDEQVCAELGIAKGATILDPVLSETINVFFAWQSEYNPSRSKITEALGEVVEELSKVPGIVRPLRILQATDAGDGAVRIDQQLLDRIKASEIFVGDITPVLAHERRLHANNNVLVETGYALATMLPEQVVLLARTREELAKDNPEFAFDIRNVRRCDFVSKKPLRDWLRTELEAILRKRGWLHG